MMWKKMIWILLYTILGVISFAMLYLASDWLLSRIPAYRQNPDVKEEPLTLYLLTNGVHTDLVFPVKSEQIDWHTIFPYQHTLAQDSAKNWIAIGWGDKGFYLNTPEWKDLSLKTALVAGLGIGQSALHVTYYRRLIENDQCIKFHVSAEQYQQLVAFVLSTIEYADDDHPVLIQTEAQYGNDDAFYEALGAYHLFYSCNTWTNAALKSARLPSAVWTVFDKGILRHYQPKNNKILKP